MTAPTTALRAARALCARDQCECAYTAIWFCAPDAGVQAAALSRFAAAAGVEITDTGHKPLFHWWDAATAEERAAAWDRAIEQIEGRKCRSI